MTYDEYMKKYGQSRSNKNTASSVQEEKENTGAFDRYMQRYGDARQERVQESGEDIFSRLERFESNYHSYWDSAVKNLEDVNYANASSLWADNTKASEALRNEADGILRSLHGNVDRYNPESYKAAVDYLTQVGYDLDKLGEEFSNSRRYYGQWDTEDDYNAYLEAEKLRQQMMGEDLGLLEKEIQELENQRDSYELDWTNYQERKKYEAFEQLISDKRKYLGEVRQLQDGVVQAQERAEDDQKRWAELSGGYDPIENGDEGKQGWSDYLATQARIDKEAHNAEADKSWWEKLAGYLGDVGQDTSLPVHHTENSKQGYRDWESKMMKPDDRWSDSQRLNFGYLWKTDRSKAANFAYAVNNMLNVQEEQAQRQKIAEGATGSFGAGLGHTAGSIFSGMLGTADYLGDIIASDTLGYIPEDDGEITPFEYSQAVQGSIGEHLNTEYGTLDEDIPVLGGRGWGDVYGLGVSAAQSFVGGKTIGTFGTLTSFFGSAAAAGVDDAKKRGATDDQALIYGNICGAAEVITEMFPLDHLMKMGSAANWEGIFADIIKQGGEEFLGEGASSVITNVADYLTFGDKSNYEAAKKLYMDRGYSEDEAAKEAFWDVVEEVTFDALGGFATGSTSAGGVRTGAGVVNGISRLISKSGANTAGQTSTNAPVGTDGVQQRTDGVDVRQREDAPGREAPVSLYDDAAVNETSRQEPAVQETAAEDPLWALAQEVAADQREAENARQEDLDGAETAGDAREDIGDVREQTQSEGIYEAVEDAPTVQGQQTAEAVSDPVWEAAHTVARETRQQQEAPAEEQLTDTQPETVPQTKAAEKERLIYGKYTGIREIQRGKVLLDVFNGDVNDSSKMDPNWHEEFNACKLLSRIRDHIDIDTGNQLLGKLAEHRYAVEGASVRGMEQAYNYGYAGYDRSAMEGKHTMAALVPEDVRNILYDMGAQYRQTVDAGKAKGKTKPAPKPKTVKVKSDQNIKPVREDSGKHRGPDVSRYKNVQFEGDITRWGKKQQAEVEFVDFIAKNFSGNQVHVYESYKNADGKYVYTDSLGRVQKAHNGVYVEKNGDIYLDLNAGNHSEGLVMNTFAHELYHHIEKQAPEQAKALAEFIAKELGEENVEAAVNRQIEKARNDGYGESFFEEQGMSAEEARQKVRDRAYSDFIADGLETMFTKGDVVHKLADLHKQDKGLSHTIRKFIRKWVSKLREFYNAGNTLSIEGRLVAELKTFDEIQQMFAKALKIAGENYRAQKNTAGGGGFDLFSGRENGSLDDSEIQEVQSIGRKSVNSFTTSDIKKTEGLARRYWSEMKEKSPFFRAWFGDWRVNDQTPVQIADQQGNTRGVQHNEDTGWDIQVSGKVFAESKHFANKNKAAIQYLPYINDIVKKAVLLDSFGVGEEKAKSSNTLLMHSLYAVADVGNGPEVLKLYIEEMHDPNRKNTTKRAYQLQNIEKAFAATGGVQGKAPSSLAIATNAIHTVADLFDAVKNRDNNFMPKPTSKAVDENGKPKIYYHGTNAEWTIYDLSRNVNQMWGEGIYLAETEERARLYGDNVIPLYVRALYNNRDARREGVVRDHTRMKNGDLLVYSPEQIKSATDNIGTFDGANPDIRYSTRDTESVSNRSLLANALDSVAQDESEKRRLAEYREAIGKLEGYEKHLAELKEQIRELSFGKGPRDMEKLRALKDEAIKTANRIGIYDKKLLRLESTKTLERLLNRETERVRQLEKQRGLDAKKKAVAEARAAGEQKLKDVRAAQKRNVESRHKTQARHEIQKTAGELKKLFARGKDVRNVKLEMRDMVAKSLELAEKLFDPSLSDENLLRSGVEVVMTAQMAQRFREGQELMAQLDAMSTKDPQRPKLLHQLRKIKSDLEDVFSAERERINGTAVSDLMDGICNAYQELQYSDKDYIRAAYNPEDLAYLQGIKENLGAVRAVDMDLKQLQELSKAYRMVLGTIRSANTHFVDGYKETVEQTAKQLMRELSDRRTVGKVRKALRDWMDARGWDYEKPFYALDRIGSKTLKRLYQGLMDAENITHRDVMEAKTEQMRLVEKYGYNTWKVDRKMPQEFVDNTGKSFRMTLGEVMSLYAYSRRDVAQKHIEVGGFTLKQKSGDAVTYKLTLEQCKGITDLLTKEQKAFVEEMQTFLSQNMGAKGNEVSMKIRGIELFGEENYFPIHTDKRFMATAQEAKAKEEAGFGSLSNAGFTKATNKNAVAPMAIDPFMTVWADHVNEMSRYHGAVPALEDIRRVMNYSRYNDAEADSMSVKAALENAYGKKAVQYLDALYREANSGAVTDRLDMENTSRRMLSRFRKNAVAYSASVVIQQPGSLCRAFAMIDKKYFGGVRGMGTLIGGVAKTVSNPLTKIQNKAYAEMLKYAPGVTLAKEIGGFDTTGGSSIRSYLLDTERGFRDTLRVGTGKEKAGLLLGVVDDNPIANLPNVADKLAWIEIWNACKRETLAKNTDLVPGSEAALEKAGERFTEVIRATQVYDSMFAKSPRLKSKSLAIQYAVSFMNEPNTTANLVESAMRDARKGQWGQATKKVTAVVRSTILTCVLKSLIYALRDDDEDETYIEKYVASLTGNLLSDINVLNYFPITKDAWGLLQGFEVERPDTAVLGDAINALVNVCTNTFKDVSDLSEEELAEWDKKCIQANWKLVDSVAAFFGIPVKNIRREVNAVLDHAAIAAKNRGMTSWIGVEQAVRQGIAEASPIIVNQDLGSKTDRLYQAVMAGDKAYEARLKGSYKDDDAYNAALRKALRDNDPRIRQAAEARMTGDFATYKKLLHEIKDEGKFSFDRIMEAINGEETALKRKNREEGTQEKATEPEYEGIFDEEDYFLAVKNGDIASQKMIYDALVAEKEFEGYITHEAESQIASALVTRIGKAYMSEEISAAQALAMLEDHTEKGESQIKIWDFELEHNFPWSARVRKYRLGDLSEQDLMDAVMDIEGATAQEAREYIQFLDLEKQYPDIDITAANAAKYFADAKPRGISVDRFMDYVHVEDKYLAGEITASTAQKLIMEVGELDEEDARCQVLVYDWKNEGYYGVTLAAVREYEEYCAASQVPRDAYLRIRKIKNNTENDVDENGKTVRYSAVKKVMEQIGKLNISDAQKEAIAKSMGWADSTIRKYKTW